MYLSRVKIDQQNREKMRELSHLGAFLKNSNVIHEAANCGELILSKEISICWL